MSDQPDEAERGANDPLKRPRVIAAEGVDTDRRTIRTLQAYRQRMDDLKEKLDTMSGEGATPIAIVDLSRDVAELHKFFEENLGLWEQVAESKEQVVLELDTSDKDLAG